MNRMGPFLSMLLLNKADGAGGSGSKSLCSPHKALQWNSMGREKVKGQMRATCVCARNTHTHTDTHILIQSNC